MNKAGKLLFMLFFALAFSVGTANADVYATTDMTWAEFYAGEIGLPSSDLAVSYDAVSSATSNFARRFTQLVSETVPAETGAPVSGDGKVTKYYGPKAVHVKMTDAVYNTLSKDKRYTFITDGSQFSEYKEVSADGSFGKMVTEYIKAEDASVSLTAPGVWGNYVLNISGLNLDSFDLKITSGEGRSATFDYYLGGTLETADGSVYGLMHLNNLWVNTGEIAFTVEDFSEPHGNHPSYLHTADIPGKTITKLRFMLKDQKDPYIETSVYVKKQTSAKVSPESKSYKSGSNLSIPLTFSGVPDDANYSLASVTFLPLGGARIDRKTLTASDYTYSDGKLSLSKAEAGSYTATFTSANYVDIVASITVTDYYATTNMTWAEFYAGETKQSATELLAAGLDAISTPTVGHLERFPLLWGAENDGTIISGEKAVQVRMTGDVYSSITDKSRYTFSDDVFTEYKTVSADGTFGAMVSETAKASGATVTLATGASARWGNYVLSVSGVNIDLGTSDDKITRNYLGVLVETSDGKIYGMRHDNNLWSNTDIAITVNENYTEPHGQGTKRFYEYTKDLSGKTITKITYMLKGIPDVVIDSLDIYLKPIPEASVKPASTYTPGANKTITFIFSGIPSDADYTLSSFYKAVGKNRTNVSYSSYSNGVMTVSGDLAAGTYTALFTSEKYADISATVDVGNFKYATTNMTWAEFYAGETGKTSEDLLSAGLDAVSSSTARIANGQTQLTSVSNDNGGRDITGVKAVQVRFDEAAYTALSKDLRFTFTNDVFTQYKPANADGSFGAMVSEKKTMANAEVTLSSGASATWGSYMLDISGLGNLVLTSGDQRYYLGAVLETSDGAKYGLRHNNNLWMNAGTIAITVNDKYVEPHGVTRDYKYTASLEGKTVTRITFIIKNQPSPVVNCSVKLKPMTTATVSLPASANLKAGVNVPVSFTFGSLPEGVTYTLKALYSGTGKGRTAITDYTYENGILTLNGTLAGGTYRAIFGTDDYADIGVDFTVEDVYHYATTDMSWAEFYAGETGKASDDLYTAGLDAISSPTARVATRFTQLTSESNDIGGRSITGVAAVQVRMGEAVYQALSNDSRYTFGTEAFSEYKDVNSDGSFGKMVTETHVQEGATVTLTTPGTWGDYQLSVSSIDVTVSSGDEYYYLGALVETSDGEIYGMRHNNNLWFNARDLAISTAEFVEPHGVSRSYAYTSDMEGKTITKITYMLKNLPDEIVSCDVFLKLKTSASVSPTYPDGYHAFMAGQNLNVPLVFSNVPASADYSLSGVTLGTGRNRQAVSGCTFSDGTLTIAGTVGEGTYTATFTDETYANIAATIRVYTTEATDKIISADRNAAGLMFLLTPAGVSDATDAVLAAQNFVNATDYTVIASNDTAIYTGGANQISGSGFTLNVALKDVPSGKMGILGFSNAFEITPAKIGSNDYTSILSKVNALPDVAYGWRVPTGAQLKDMGLIVTAIYPDGVSRDITDYVSAGLLPGDGSITMSYGTVLIDRAFTQSEEGKVYALSPEGEGTMSDGAADGKITATWYVMTPGGSSSGNGGNSGGEEDSKDIEPVPSTSKTVYPSTPSGIFGGESLTEAVKGTVLNALSALDSRITADTPVIAGLPPSAIVGEQSSRTDTQAVYLPVISIDVTGVYIFGVSLDNLPAGGTLAWHSNGIDMTTGEFVGADNDDTAKFYNDAGTEITTVPDTTPRHANVAAYFETGNEYSPTITASTEDTDSEIGVSSSSGGCNAGLSITMIFAGLGFLFTRKK